MLEYCVYMLGEYVVISSARKCTSWHPNKEYFTLISKSFECTAIVFVPVDVPTPSYTFKLKMAPLKTTCFWCIVGGVHQSIQHIHQTIKATVKHQDACLDDFYFC
eukprot:GHVO01026944.1.p1 GENE.GHVO01026944.1~~GHVO01026944.1.p1  ORF type:complete len:105 (-),score=10.96 GHVO01026944.1:291-605(-)